MNNLVAKCNDLSLQPQQSLRGRTTHRLDSVQSAQTRSSERESYETSNENLQVLSDSVFCGIHIKPLGRETLDRKTMKSRPNVANVVPVFPS